MPPARTRVRASADFLVARPPVNSVTAIPLRLQLELWKFRTERRPNNHNQPAYRILPLAGRRLHGERSAKELAGAALEIPYP